MRLTNSVISVRGGADSLLKPFVSLGQSTFYISQIAPDIPQNVLYGSKEDKHSLVG